VGKLTVESNGWILAALVGYLYGRGTQKQEKNKRLSQHSKR